MIGFKNWLPSKWFQSAQRDLRGLKRREIYAFILEELPLPGWLLEIIRQPLDDLQWTPRQETHEDYSGTYSYWLLHNNAGRTALVYVAADVVQDAFGRIGDLAKQIESQGVADRLFIFSEAPLVSSDILAQKDNWFPGGNVIFCFANQIERLRRTTDPGERKALLRIWFEVPQPPAISAGVASNASVELDDVTRETLVTVLARASEKQITGVHRYFDALLDRSQLQGSWTADARMRFAASADTNARILIEMALAEGERGSPRGHTVLGHLLNTALPYLPSVREESIIVAVILLKGLITAQSELQKLRTRYAVPESGASLIDAQDIGPEIDWLGPYDEIELQSYDRPASLLLLDDLPKAIEQGGSVCLIRVPGVSDDRTGTGFLVAPDLVLTNCHNLLKDWDVPEKEQMEEALENARTVTFRFRFVRGDEKEAPEGLLFNAAKKDPLVKLSPVRRLDCALLRMEKPVTGTKGIQPAGYIETCPTPGSALHILQHPQGGEMRVDFNVSGVTRVKPELGLLQYATQTASGSSGAPCFNSDWKVVGLHHSERSRFTRRIREGILLRSILEEIRDEIPTTQTTEVL